MTTYTKLLLAAAVATPAILAGTPAHAQVAGIAIAEPEAAILQSKALEDANKSIATTYKAQLDQARSRQTALQTEISTLALPLDTNKDKQLSESEIAAADAAKNPAMAKLRTVQTTGQQEVARLNGPATRAQGYAIEKISEQYNPAMNKVVEAKRISLLLTSGSVQFAQPVVDVTSAITDEINKAYPAASVTPPANWQPSQQTVQLQQAYQRLIYMEAMQRAQAAQAAPGAAAPAGAPAPAGGAAATPPKTPTEGR